MQTHLRSFLAQEQDMVQREGDNYKSGKVRLSNKANPLNMEEVLCIPLPALRVFRQLVL